MAICDIKGTYGPLYYHYIHSSFIFFYADSLGFSCSSCFGEGSFFFILFPTVLRCEANTRQSDTSYSLGLGESQNYSIEINKKGCNKPTFLYNSFESQIISISIYQIRTAGEGDNILPTRGTCDDE